MNFQALLGSLAFWKPKSERIAAKRPRVPDAKPQIDVFGGMRLLTRVRNSLWGRIGHRAKDAEAAFYGSTCQSKRRGRTRAAILPSDRARELRNSRRPAKPRPRIVEKQLINGHWVRPEFEKPRAIQAA